MESRPSEVAFTPYTDYSPSCSVTIVTPPEAGYIHTYYDVCPWSPSGRFLTCLRLPREDRQPLPRERAHVCVIDLKERTIRPVWETQAWGFQTGAHEAWGKTDRTLYFNDWRGGGPVGVRLDLQTGEARHLEGTIRAVSPDETYSISPCMIRCNLTQEGYGVAVHPHEQLTNPVRASADDGFYRTDLATGKKTLLVTLADIWEVLPNKDELMDTVLYAFHAKINAGATRLLLVARAIPPKGKYWPMLLTCRADGTGLRCLMSTARWAYGDGSGHPGWHPDGRHALMNITMKKDYRQFGLIDADTGEITTLMEEPEGTEGTGHPSIDPSQRWLVTDKKKSSGGKRLTNIVYADVQMGAAARDLCSVESPDPDEAPLRVDGHPVWNRDGNLICFQGAPAARRRLFIAAPSFPPGQAPRLS